MSATETPIRFDFDVQVLDTNEETGVVSFALRLNPDRYTEAVLDDGTHAWHDRFDDLYITDDALADLAEMVRRLPIGFQHQHAGPLVDYLEGSLGRARAALGCGSASDHDFADASDEWLRSRADDELGFAILSVDLVGSTALSQSLPVRDYARLQVVLQDELSALVPLFGGHVLKYTGDGLLAYFPEPSLIVKNDLALECALYMRAVVNRAINEALREAGLPTIQIRIGVDTGRAAVMVVGSASTKRHADVIGQVVSLACKVEKHAGADGIAIGGSCWRSLHTSWREHCRRLQTPPDWSYCSADDEPYLLFALDPGVVEQLALGSTDNKS
jgi:adenylate cyclase